MDVSPSSSTVISLASTSGVDIWSIRCLATDETSNAASINASLVIDNIAKTATFTSPVAGSALIFESKINNAKDVDGRVRSDYVARFIIHTLFAGNRVAAAGETTESDPVFGWVAKFNSLIRAIGAAITVDLSDPSATSGTLLYQRGGLQANVSSFNGLVGIASGTITYNVPVPSSTIVGVDDTQTLTNKVIDALTNSISNIRDGNLAPDAAIGLSKLANAPTAGYYIRSAGGGIPTWTVASAGAGNTGPQGPQGIQGSPGVTGPVGPQGATGTVFLSGDLYSGPTGPAVMQVYGISQANATGGNVDVRAGRTTNKSAAKTTIYTDQVEKISAVNGWQNLFVYSLDDNIAGATAAYNHTDAIISAIQSSPTPGYYAANWKMTHDVKRQMSLTNGVPSGTFATMVSEIKDNASWLATCSASGMTGYVQVNSQSGNTIAWGGVVQRTRITM